MKGGAVRMKQRIMIPVAVLTITGALLLGAAGTQAQGLKSEPTNLIQKIAQKFGLNEADVKAIFEEERVSMEKQLQTRQEERLNQLVSEGKITEAQKKLIVNKQAELQASREKNFESMKDMTPEQRRTAMENQRKSLEKWAQDNRIELQYLMGKFGGHGMKGPRPGKAN